MSHLINMDNSITNDKIFWDIRLNFTRSKNAFNSMITHHVKNVNRLSSAINRITKMDYLKNS